MISSRAMSRVPLLAAAAWALAMGLVPGRAEAGEYLKLAQLAAKAAAIAVVDVKLTRGKQAPSVTLVRTLRSPRMSAATINPDHTWLGLCLADRKHLQRWLHQHPRWPARKLWQRALARPGYQAVVFLAPPLGKNDGPLAPTCGVEAMDLLHADLHPTYPAYLKDAESLASTPPPP
jgi:hypothetical protein